MLIINVYSKGSYPADALSNFAPHSFCFEGGEFKCMESFLQSLKFKDIYEQRQIWSLSGKEAKSMGSEQEWHRFLYWNGKPIDRFSKQYIQLVESAYQNMFDQNSDYREALQATKGHLLLHTIGKLRRSNTVVLL